MLLCTMRRGQPSVLETLLAIRRVLSATPPCALSDAANADVLWPWTGGVEELQHRAVAIVHTALRMLASSPPVRKQPSRSARRATDARLSDGAGDKNCHQADEMRASNPLSALLAAASSLPRAHLHGSGSLRDEFAKRAKDSGLLRPTALQDAEAGLLWAGAVPQPEYSAVDVIELTLRALRNNDDPQPHAGTALLRRFATADFHVPGEPMSPRLQPQELTAFFETNQYGLLLKRNEYLASFPSDTVELDDTRAWQEVCLEAPADGDGEEPLLVKMGWSLVRRGADGCWVTEAISWHDFREGFRPGIGEEEWDRSFG